MDYSAAHGAAMPQLDRGTMTSAGLPQPGALWRPVVLSLSFLAASLAVYLLLIRTETGQHFDASTFGAVIWVREAIGPWSEILRDALTVVAGGILLLLLIIALVKQRLQDATAAAAVAALSLIVSTVLKSVIDRPFLGEFGYLVNTFPSSRAAATVGALIGVYWLLRGRFRQPVLLLLLALGASAGLFQVVSYAHRLSDALGGALLAGLIAALFVGRGGGLSVAWRWVLWSLTVVMAVVGALCLSTWEGSGYETSQQVTGTVGILLAVAACVMAGLIVGAERPMRSATRAIGGGQHPPVPTVQS